MSYSEYIEFEKRTNKEVEKLQKDIDSIKKNQSKFIENVFKNKDYILEVIKTYFSINKLEFKPNSNKFGFTLDTKKTEYPIFLGDSWSGGQFTIGRFQFEKFFTTNFGLKIGKTYWDSSYSEDSYGISLVPEDSSKFENFYPIFDFKKQYEDLQVDRKIQIDKITHNIKILQEKLKELKK